MLKKTLHLPPQPESIHPVLQAAGSMVTGLSQFIQIYMAWQQKQRDDDIQHFAEDVISRLDEICHEQEKMGNTVDKIVNGDSFWSQKFYRNFRSAYLCYAMSPDEDKRQYLVDYVVNFAKCRRPDLSLEKLFWRYISGLSGIHIKVMGILYGKQGHLNMTDLSAVAGDRDSHTLVSVTAIQGQMELDPVFVQCLVADIQKDGLCSIIEEPSSGEDRSRRLCLTASGLKFMRFLMGDWTEGGGQD